MAFEKEEEDVFMFQFDEELEGCTLQQIRETPCVARPISNPYKAEQAQQLPSEKKKSDTDFFRPKKKQTKPAVKQTSLIKRR